MPSEYETKSRSETGPSPRYRSMIVWNGQVYGDTTYDSGISPFISKWEELVSRRNGWRGRSSSRDVGGNFSKLTFTHDRKVVPFDWNSGFYHYYGSLLAHPGVLTAGHVRTGFDDIIPSSESMLVAGTRFISEASPTAPKAGLSTALVELKREGLPRLSSETLSALFSPKTMRKAGKGAGSDYLNWQFGWAPIISDLRKLAKSVIEADSLLSQLYSDDGKLVRRKRGNSRQLETVHEDVVVSSESGYPSLPTAAYPSGPGVVTTTTKVVRARWFSGAFMYHLPEQVGPLGDLHRLAIEARVLYGLGASPIDVWNLTPWSWLVDWGINSGDVLSNFSDQLYSNQVLKYGYTMCHTTKTVVDETTVNIGGQWLTPTSTRVYDVKVRTQATPFGFGLSWDGFSPYQLSILSALGLARGK